MTVPVVSRLLDLEEADGSETYHVLAVVSVGLLTASYLAVLYHLVDVVGGVTRFVGIVVVAVVMGVLFRFLSRRNAVVLASVLLVGGLVVYLATMPESRLSQLSVDRIIQDQIALLTGFSVLQMTNVQTWALAVTAGPTFLTTYFALRREYRYAVVVASLTLSFFVLTGDSGPVGTMLGVLGASGAIGFGTLAVHRATRVQGEVLAGIFALMVIGAGTVTAVPGGASPLVPPGATGTSGDLVNTENRLAIGGSLTLSPEVLFTVESEESAYWRVTAYDRFTGSSWIRTGTGRGDPAKRPGRTYEMTHEVTARQTLDVYPAAPTPARVSGIDASVTQFGDLKGETTLYEQESYTVVSERPFAPRSVLQNAGTGYPQEIRNRYLEVPESTSQRVRTLSEEITADAHTPYEKAIAIENWLEQQKGYSLEVSRPEGNVVDQFLFEMDAGYCVYFASSMAVMLRSQGVPARFVVGYTPGQQVDNGTYVVRGLDSHAWVEVYFPEVGWVKFDPTPSTPRLEAEYDTIEEAREEGEPGVDALGSSRENLTVEESDAQLGSVANETISSDSRLRQAEDLAPYLNVSDQGQTESPGVNATLSAIEDGASDGPSIPPPERLAVWAVLAIGIITGGRRTHAVERTYRYLWLHWLPRDDPAATIEGAYERVEYLLESETRKRRPGETVREYTRSVTDDERIRTITQLRERLRYAGDAREANASEARELARAVIADHLAASRFYPSTMFNRLLS